MEKEEKRKRTKAKRKSKLLADESIDDVIDDDETTSEVSEILPRIRKEVAKEEEAGDGDDDVFTGVPDPPSSPSELGKSKKSIFLLFTNVEPANRQYSVILVHKVQSNLSFFFNSFIFRS